MSFTTCSYDIVHNVQALTGLSSVFLKESEASNPARSEDDRQNDLNEEDALVDEEVVPGL